MGIGLTIVALLARVRWIPAFATIAAPALATITIGIMTIPAHLDAISTTTLASCHLTLVPISVLAIRHLRR